MEKENTIISDKNILKEKELDFNIFLSDESKILNHFSKENENELLSSSDTVKKSIEEITLGVTKEKQFEHKKVIYTIFPKGDFFINKKMIALIVCVLLVFFYFGWFFIIQLFMVFAVLTIKKTYDDREQKIILEKDKLIFKNNIEISLKSINNILLADLKSRTIIDEKSLSYHWYVENLILEDINNEIKDENVLLNKEKKLEKGRYSILIRVEDKDIEILRGLSWTQSMIMWKQLTD